MTPSPKASCRAVLSLHNTMLPHGPDADAFEHASNVELKPVKLTNTLAFMFETRFRQRVTKFAAESRQPAGQLHRLLGRPEEAFRSEAARAEMNEAGCRLSSLPASG